VFVGVGEGLGVAVAVGWQTPQSCGQLLHVSPAPQTLFGQVGGCVTTGGGGHHMQVFPPPQTPPLGAHELEPLHEVLSILAD
jgi:hypothetical protein